jgi:DNA polymerase III epsilon subunit-like protein
MLKDTYVVLDVETTGKVPSQHKTLSVGAVAMINGQIQREKIFYAAINHACVIEKDGEIGKATDPWWDPDTYEWWHQPSMSVAWAYLKEDMLRGQSEYMVALAFYGWLKSLPGPISLVADPAAFDAGFIWELLYRQLGMEAIDKLGRMRIVDIRTMRMLYYKVEYSKAQRDLIPESVTIGEAITHRASDDAMHQALQFQYLMKETMKK